MAPRADVVRVAAGLLPLPPHAPDEVPVLVGRVPGDQGRIRGRGAEPTPLAREERRAEPVRRGGRVGEALLDGARQRRDGLVVEVRRVDEVGVGAEARQGTRQGQRSGEDGRLEQPEVAEASGRSPLGGPDGGQHPSVERAQEREVGDSRREPRTRLVQQVVARDRRIGGEAARQRGPGLHEVGLHAAEIEVERLEGGLDGERHLPQGHAAGGGRPDELRRPGRSAVPTDDGLQGSGTGHAIRRPDGGAPRVLVHVEDHVDVVGAGPADDLLDAVEVRPVDGPRPRFEP